MQIKLFIFLTIFAPLTIFAGPKIINRNSWTFANTDTTKSGIPSNLKFLKFYDMLPDEISTQLLNKRDLSGFGGKHVYVGYGIVDPKGTDCKIFPASATGMDQNITICLPWWRIEREYEKSIVNIKDLSNILCEIPTPHPPIKVNVCKTWTNSGVLNTEGGKFTCTSYFNRLLSADCWDNPKQAKCFVDNCSMYTKNNCELNASNMGEKTALVTAIEEIGTSKPKETKINLVTHQYICPAGSMVEHTDCLEEESVLMFPYECSPNNPDTLYDDSKYIYCDEDKVQYDSGGSIVGFLGKCPNGETVMCDVNVFSQTTNICKEPIYATVTNTSLRHVSEEKTYKEYTVDVMSGEPDIYAQKSNCVRSNTIAESRDNNVTAHIIGNGNLDDDIWVVKHRGDETHLTIYCNEQHNSGHSNQKMYDGIMEQCVGNNGTYSFDKTVGINSSDIVTIQQATEFENNSGVPFAGGRTTFRSTKVTIDGTTAAPQTDISDYPSYPKGDKYFLSLWENSLGNLSILFPYTGAYKLSFFDKYGNSIATYTVATDDFDDMKIHEFVQLQLVKDIAFNPNFDPTNDNTNCLDDDFAEIGGGVFGDRSSKTGTPCQSPDGSFAKEHAIYKIIAKDLLTGNIVQIPLIYPLVYANRIFIAKLKLHELRKYRCYSEFKEDVLP